MKLHAGNRDATYDDKWGTRMQLCNGPDTLDSVAHDVMKLARVREELFDRPR